MRNKNTALWASIGLAVVLCIGPLVLHGGATTPEDATFLTFNRAVELHGHSLDSPV